MLNHLPENRHLIQAAIDQLKGIRDTLDSDPRSFASLINTLKTTYKEIISTRNSNILIFPEKNNILTRLSGLLGENQKSLPWFILQVFCNPVPDHPLPDYTQEPERECILVITHDKLDLHCIGYEFNYALNKGWGGEHRVVTDRYSGLAAVEHLAVFNRLCEVIKSELNKIIKLQEIKLQEIKLKEQRLMLAAYPNAENTSPSDSNPAPSLR